MFRCGGDWILPGDLAGGNGAAERIQDVALVRSNYGQEGLIHVLQVLGGSGSG